MNEPSLSKRQIALVMTGAMLTLLLAALDNTIVSTAMPKIISDLNGMEHYAWPFTAYMFFSTLILPISGKLADIYGRKRITLLGIAVFALTSMWCGFSRNMIELSVLRGFQGIGGGICISSAFIIVSEIFPLGTRAQYMGLLTSMFALASIVGPGAGGVITDTLSWRWVFFVNIPLSIVAFILIVRNLPVLIHQDKKRKIDVSGVILFVLAALPLLWVISQVGSRPFLSAGTLAPLLFSTGMFALFLRIEKRSSEPLLSLHFFREKIFTVSMVASSLGNMAVFGAAIYFPLYLQSVRGESATRAGFIMMPMMVSMILASNLSGFLVSRLHRFKAPAVFGLLLSCGGMFSFGFWGEGASTPVLIAFSSLAGVGLGLTFPIFSVAPQAVFPPQQVGVVISLLQFFRSLGGSIGSALFGAIMISRMNAGMAGLSLGTLPASIAELVKNPGVIANPLKMGAIRGSLPKAILADFDRFVTLCLHSIAGSIETIFLFSAGLLLAAFLLVLISFHERKVLHAVAAQNEITK